MSTASDGQAPGLRLPVALASVYLVWGSTYLALRIAVRGMPPMLLVGVRYLIAGAILLAVLALRGAALPTARQWLRALPLGVLFFCGGNGFVALGQREIGSGLAAVIVATMPLWMAIFSAVAGERPSRRELVGLLIGVAGVAVLSLDGELRGAPLSAFFLFLAPLSWAIGSVLARRVDLPSGPMAAAAEMLAGGAAALVLGLAVGERWSEVPSQATVLAIVYLVAFGSLVGFVAYAWLLAHTRPALATSYAFVNPVIAMVLGAALGAEQFGWQALVAVPVVIGAVALVVTGRSKTSAHSTTTPPQGNSASSETSVADR